MSTSRRDFLKTTAVAGAGVAIGGLPAWAKPIGTPAAQASAAAGGPGQSVSAIEYTRGVGIYPGAPGEDFSPELVPDSATYRNLALLRPAYHSSSYDYNLTAQLATEASRRRGSPNGLWSPTNFAGRYPRKSERFPSLIFP